METLRPTAPASPRLWHHVTAGLVVLLVVASTMLAVAGRRGVVPTGITVGVTAANGYPAPEINFFRYLRDLDRRLVEKLPMTTLYSLGEQTCADFARGDTQNEAGRLDEAIVRRQAIRMSAVGVGELVPAAVLELCPAYLPTITTSVA